MGIASRENTAQAKLDAQTKWNTATLEQRKEALAANIGLARDKMTADKDKQLAAFAQQENMQVARLQAEMDQKQYDRETQIEVIKENAKQAKAAGDYETANAMNELLYATTLDVRASRIKEYQKNELKQQQGAEGLQPGPGVLPKPPAMGTDEPPPYKVTPQVADKAKIASSFGTYAEFKARYPKAQTSEAQWNDLVALGKRIEQERKSKYKNIDISALQ
jgi:hypothetical protein